MTEISQESRDIMRTNMGGRRRGGAGATPIDLKAAGAEMMRPPTFLERVAQFVAPVWMGPGALPATVSIPDTPPRTWDYPLFFNYSFTPDSAKAREAGVSMWQLKMLAQQTHVAMAIERVKNKQKKKQWRFGLERLPGERAFESQKRVADDPRIKEVTDFFKMPDGENELPEWLGLNLDNWLKCGVTSVVPWRKVNGQPYRLQVYDPATIVPRLDDGGRRPMGLDPVTGLPAVAFQQYIKGLAYANFADADMLWYGPNPVPGLAYQVGPTEQLLLYINLALRKDTQRMAAYTSGNIPAGFLPLPTDWKQEQIDAFYRSFNLYLIDAPENLAKIIPIPYAGAGGGPIFPQLANLTDNWEENWTRIVCSVYNIPVSSLVTEMTHANAAENTGQANEEGEQFYEDVCRRFINRNVVKFFGYTDVVVRTATEVEMDLKVQADIDIMRVSIGLDQPNEIRERDGKEPIAALIGVEGYYNASGDFVPFMAGGASAADSGDGADTAVVIAPQPEGEEAVANRSAAANVQLNGAQVTAASAIVTAVVAGLMPRDSGIGQLQVLFSLTPEQANLIMGSAGTDTPTTPNPNPKEEAAVEAAAAADQSAKIAIPTDDGRILKFAPGTMVRTQRGLVKVEELKEGDRVPTVRSAAGYSSRIEA